MREKTTGTLDKINMPEYKIYVRNFQKRLLLHIDIKNVKTILPSK